MKKAFDLESVLSRLAGDNSAAIEELYDYYYPRLYNFSKSFLKMSDGIDDILQEVFIKIWQNRNNITSSTTFNSYIFVITRNLLLNELRTRLNNSRLREFIAKQSVVVEYSSEQSEYNELKEKVDSMINELPERQKEIFILSRIDGLTHKEIAEKLAISLKTVEYHITRATGFLKGKLKDFNLVSILFLIFFL